MDCMTIDRRDQSAPVFLNARHLPPSPDSAGHRRGDEGGAPLSLRASAHDTVADTLSIGWRTVSLVAVGLVVSAAAAVLAASRRKPG